jgi:2,3-bisphosphoglycerate-independent phosphoglycerate mutase
MKKPIMPLHYGTVNGFRHEEAGKPFLLAKETKSRQVFANYPFTEIETSGESVGLPDGQMGNSEVGHLNIEPVASSYQSLTLINKSGPRRHTFFENEKVPQRHKSRQKSIILTTHLRTR